MISEIGVQTRGQGLYEFTNLFRSEIRLTGDGLVTLFVRHTSCSLLIQENADPDVVRDLKAFFHCLVPPADDPSMHYLRHVAEGPDDMPAHIKAAMLPVSLNVPVRDGQLMLGTWQGLYLFEHRTAPHQRRIAIHFSRDAAAP